MLRRKVMNYWGVGLMALCHLSLGWSAEYPIRPVRMVVGLGAGGGSDTVARLLASKLTQALGQTVVVDNRPSAGGVIACEVVAKAAPDGYTLLAMSPTHVVTPILRPSVGYDALRDFSPILLSVYTPYVLSVKQSIPITNLKELIALAKTQKLNFSSSGVGGASHLTAELFKHMAGIDMIHVPYKSGSQANSALMSGEVSMSFTAIGGLVGYIQSGRIRALGVTSLKRASALPDIPTISEAGVPGYEVLGWYGLGATAHTPPAVIQKLNQVVNRVLPDLREPYARIGTEIAGGSVEQFRDYLLQEIQKWTRVIEFSGAKAHSQ